VAWHSAPPVPGRLGGLVILLVSGVLPAQELIAPGSEFERVAIDTFTRAAAAPELPCSVRKYGPRLSFALRYWSGYEVTIPARNLRALPGARLQILLRATPRGGAPRYFYQRRPMPELPADPRALKRIDLFVSGGVAMGAGDYELSLHVSDSSDRVCRSTWRVTAPVAKVPLRLEAGEVADGYADRWRGIPAKNSSGLVTIFLHAAPVLPRRTLTRLSPWDSAVLLGSLTSLLDTLPFPRARVVAYNLDSREILFSDPQFAPEGLAKLAERLDNLNLGLISANALRRASPADILREVVEAELRNPDPADAIIFLGPLSRYFGKAPPEWKRFSEVLPATYGVAVYPRFGQTGDIIQSLVKAAGGQTVMVYQPADLARAVREITKVESN
jgi:hypothetical protein